MVERSVWPSHVCMLRICPVFLHVDVRVLLVVSCCDTKCHIWCNKPKLPSSAYLKANAKSVSDQF